MTENVKNCIEQAERFLVLREHNKNELIDKLKQKKYDLQTINEAVSFLQESDELDEERYINVFVRSSNRKHPEGKSLVYQRLIAKKADKNLSKKVLDDLYCEEYTLQLIEEATKKIYRKVKSDSFSNEVRQELMKKGFSASDIYIYINSL